ncbi:MAG: uroporphyrinogen decarboxylase family protein [Rhodospirillales bacterium]|nr:uroporphyrinogen decarboxylase family protein [Rhodospirillales bacterium]MDP7425041.1 uroporphyrinogen decarboxylase family protein [Rhodospirillales bacterium]MDP7611564.1 uroporphyrinogen decarboxylase family protein [Nitrospinaceae bacterium]
MARPESTSLVDWPVETLLAHEPFGDPLAGFPPPEAQAQGLMEMAGNILKKRDSGETLNRMERTIMVGTNNHADRIPTYSFFTDGPAIYYGYTVREVEQNPKLHADIVTRWTEEFGFEALGEGIDTMNSEIEAMGLVRMKFPQNAPGDVKIRLMDDMSDEEALDFWAEAAEKFNPFTDGRLPRRIELYGHLVEQLTQQRGWPVLAAPSSTYAQTINAIGFKRAFNWMRRKPENFHRAIQTQLSANLKWYEALKSLGVTFFITIDAWNAIPNFSPKQLYEFEKPYIKPLMEAMWPTPVIYFYWGLRLAGETDENGRGGWIEFLEKCADTGTFILTNLAPDYYTPPSDDLQLFRETANRLGKSYIVGVKDEVLLSGTEAEVRAEVKNVIKGLYPCSGGCIIVPNMIPMGTPPENIHAFTQALKDYGKYPIDLDRLNSDD